MYKNGLYFTFSWLVLSLTFPLSSKVFATKIYHCKTAEGRLEIQDFPCQAITLKVQDVLIPNSSPASPLSSKAIQPVETDILNANTDIKPTINNFYSMPIHPTAINREITDAASLGVITLSYISTISSKEMEKYYLSKIPAEHNKINIRDTVMFTYEEGGTNKLVSILNEQGIADVTLQVER